MIGTSNGLYVNPCNSCQHQNCCKYINNIQKEVKEMSIIRQVQVEEKVFELLTAVSFKCEMYLREGASSGVLRDASNVEI